MLTIQTKYLGPTTYKGARIKAWCAFSKRSVIIDYDDSLDSFDNHAIAAKALVKRFDLYSGEYTVGDNSDVGYLFVANRRSIEL